MPLKTLWLNGAKVTDISALTGSSVISLTLHRTAVSDLSPLAGTRLQRLHIGETNVTDLAPLKDLPLTRLVFSPIKIKIGLEYIRSKATLKEVGTSFETLMPAEEFWSVYDEVTKR
jgi:Leucine-rich repeat (LRR) protein